MKRIKKLAALMMAAIMALAMSITAFATEPTDKTPVGNTTAGKGNFTITINDTTKGYTYQAYQIFSGDLSKAEDGSKTLSNIVWGSGVDTSKIEEKFPGMTATQVAETLTGKGFDSDEAKDFAAKIGECLSSTSVASQPVAGTEGAITGYEISPLTAGYYLVLNSQVPSDDGDFTRYMMEVVGDVNATPKRGTLEHDKSIKVKKPEGQEGVDYVKVNDAPIGGIVEYSIPVTLPQNFADYKEYYLEFSDTLTKGLTFNADSVKVIAKNGENVVDITKYFYDEATEITEGKFVGGTAITVSISDLKGLNKYDDIVINASTKIELTYSATLNVDAVIGIEGNPNYVKIIHSNDPNHSGDGTTTPPENPDKPKPVHPTGETPDKEVVTYVTELTIKKTDEAGKFLPGVEFTLTGEGVNIVLVTEETFEKAADGEYWKLKDGTYTTTAPTVADDETDNTADYESTNTKYTKKTSVVAKGNGETKTDVVGTVQADGTVTFKGLGAGEYTITETKTLSGYNTIDPITFKLSFDATTKKFTSDNDKVTVGEDNMLDTSIVNQKGSLLPSTGGIGTTIFYIVGAVLVIGAGIILVTKKRMSNEV